MSRVHVVRRSGAATLAAGFVLVSGAFAALLFYSPAAHASSPPVSLACGSNPAQLNLTTGDSVIFNSNSCNGVAVRDELYEDGTHIATLTPGSTGKSTAKPSKTVTFASSGGHIFTWIPYTVIGTKLKTGSIGVDVSAPPPPPSSDPPTASDSPTDSTTDSGTPSGSTTASGTGTPTGTATSGASTTPPGGGGGISFPHTSTIPNNPIVGFAPPPRDPNGATPTVDPGDLGSGNGTIPSGVPTSSTADGTSTDANGQPVLADKAKPVKVPTGLAIASISALAVVSSVFAYRQLGERTH